MKVHGFIKFSYSLAKRDESNELNHCRNMAPVILGKRKWLTHTNTWYCWPFGWHCVQHSVATSQTGHQLTIASFVWNWASISVILELHWLFCFLSLLRLGTAYILCILSTVCACFAMYYLRCVRSASWCNPIVSYTTCKRGFAVRRTTPGLESGQVPRSLHSRRVFNSWFDLRMSCSIFLCYLVRIHGTRKTENWVEIWLKQPIVRT